MMKRILACVLVIVTVVSAANICRTHNSVNELSEEYVPFQYIRSMDWDSEDDYLLRQIAMVKGGNVEDKARTILVTLNRVWRKEYPMSVREVVLMEVDEETLSNTVPDKECTEAMHKIIFDRFDNSMGSTEYNK